MPEHGAQEAILAATEPVRHQQIDTLYLSHHGWLQGWLRRKLGDAADAADLAHDTFVRLIVSTRAINLDDEPRAFLTHIAKGLVVDHWRRHAVERAYLDAIAHLPEPEAPSPEARLLIIESLLRIESMLDRLPANTREIFLLAQLEHLTLQEISTASTRQSSRCAGISTRRWSPAWRWPEWRLIRRRRPPATRPPTPRC